ncbi:MAG: hypothetical protein AD073_000127 [Mycoplasmataceae bacterium]|jgi:small subunit ribosomal protein S15|nr:MAG: hypothetical protein AD073_000127 [Mycoplasmataceae bacterium]
MFNKIELLKSYNIDQKNVGSSAAQIVFLNTEIREVIDHLKNNRKDVPAKRAMLKKLAKQRRLLSYLKKKDSNSHSLISAKLKELKNLKSS